MFVSAILAAAGRGTRLGSATPKQMLALGERTILQRSFDIVEAHDGIDEIVIALPPALASAPPPYLISSRKPVRIVDGGMRRQDSVAKAFAQVSKSAEVIVIHDAARPFATADLFSRVIEAAERGSAAIAAVQAHDTVKEATAAPGVRIVARTIARESIYLAQTPQAFSRAVLEDAIELGRVSSGSATDEASLAEQAGYTVRLVDGESTNIKITTEQDFAVSKALLRDSGFGIGDQRSAANWHRIRPASPGTGETSHYWRRRDTARDRPCRPFRRRCVVSCGDRRDSRRGRSGRHRSALSRYRSEVERREQHRSPERGCRHRPRGRLSVVNVDAVIVAERPKLAPHVPAMRANLAQAMGIDVSAVSVKGKTNERVDALGRNEAIAVHAVALINKC